MKTINCDSCKLPMSLVKKGRTRSTPKIKRRVIRRFHCELCDIYTTITSGGENDLIFEPMAACIKAGNVKTIKDRHELKISLEDNL